MDQAPPMIELMMTSFLFLQWEPVGQKQDSAASAARLTFFVLVLGADIHHAVADGMNVLHAEAIDLFVVPDEVLGIPGDREVNERCDPSFACIERQKPLFGMDHGNHVPLFRRRGIADHPPGRAGQAGAVAPTKPVLGRCEWFGIRVTRFELMFVGRAEAERQSAQGSDLVVQLAASSRDGLVVPVVALVIDDDHAAQERRELQLVFLQDRPALFRVGRTDDVVVLGRRVLDRTPGTAVRKRGLHVESKGQQSGHERQKLFHVNSLTVYGFSMMSRTVRTGTSSFKIIFRISGKIFVVKILSFEKAIGSFCPLSI